jgi:hypothetical protein
MSVKGERETAFDLKQAIHLRLAKKNPDVAIGVFVYGFVTTNTSLRFLGLIG